MTNIVSCISTIIISIIMTSCENREKTGKEFYEMYAKNSKESAMMTVTTKVKYYETINENHQFSIIRGGLGYESPKYHIPSKEIMVIKSGNETVNNSIGILRINDGIITFIKLAQRSAEIKIKD